MRKLIVIEGAMDDEVNVLISSLKHSKKKIIDNYTFYKGKFNHTKVIILKTNIGMVNASLSTSIAIKKFHPSLIINQGTLGAHVDDLRVFDIVIATEVVNTSFEVGGIHLKSQYVENNKWKREATLKVDEDDIAITKSLRNKKGRIIFGRIASSDFWHKSVKEIKAIREKYKTVGEEMEAFASLQVSKNYNVPYISIRVVSNNELSGEIFNSKSAEYLQKEIIKLVS